MLIEGRDYGCTDEGGVYTCWARTPEAAQVYQQLQHQIEVPISGKISATTTLAVQRVLTVLHKTVPLPPALAQIVAAPDAVQAVRALAAHADEAADYIKRTLTAYPTAYTSPPLPRLPPPAPFPVKPVLYTAGSAAFLLGVGLVTRKIGRQAAGIDEARHFLPPDQDDDSGDESADRDEGDQP